MNRFAALACVALAFALPARFAAATVINFDDTAPISGAAVTSYFAAHGITLTTSTGGQVIFDASGNGGQTPAPSAPNIFGVGGSLGPIFYSFGFASPVSSFSFTSVGLGSSSTMAAWTMTAFDSSNTQLGQINQNFIHFPGTPQATWTLTGNISHVDFMSNVQGFAGSSLLMDNVSFTPAPSVPEPGSLLLMGAALAGLGFGRRTVRTA
jgi:hypothetical protein